jgi:tetratricopeptide (TPR) repeat protein
VAVGDRLGEALVLRNLADVLMDQGDLDGAKKALQDALQIHREIGNKSGEAAGLSGLARILTAQKQIPEARQALERSMVLSREMEDEAALGIALRNIGNLEFDTGDLSGAKARYQEGLAIAKKFGSGAR